MSDESFDELAASLKTGGPAAALERLAETFRRKEEYHALFDARLMQTRYRLGLPIILTTRLEDLAEPLRGKVEDAYLEACREAGWLLWNQGKLREAWMYLRPLGENPAVAASLEKIEPTEDNRNTLIELAMQEAIAPALGFKWILKEYGTCNAITTFDSEMPRHSRVQQQTAAGHLVRQLHRDLVANVGADIAKREGAAPDSKYLLEMIVARDWLFADNSYHTDTSHLAATVRIARIVEDPEILRLARDLTEYGRRLSQTFQLEGDEPFEDVYPSHGLFFAAQLGENIAEALEYFRQRADSAPAEEVGPAAAEVYLVLLVRLGRLREALDAHVRLLSGNVALMGFAPTLLELAQLAGGYDRLMTVSRERNDLLGYTAALVAKSQTAPGAASDAPSIGVR